MQTRDAGVAPGRTARRPSRPACAQKTTLRAKIAELANQHLDISRQAIAASDEEVRELLRKLKAIRDEWEEANDELEEHRGEHGC